MKTKTAKLLPKTTSEIQNGGVYVQRVRCGKQNCKCASGEMHSAYYFFTRRNGKLTKFYIRKSEFKRFSKLVNQAAEERKMIRRSTKSSNQLLRHLRQILRERNAIIKALKEV